MALLEILKYPDERLKTVAQPVTSVTQQVRTLVSDMFETMYAASGIGLAATQVNVHQRIVVMDLSTDKQSPQVFINPEITLVGDETQVMKEGCLSVPGIYEEVERTQSCIIKALDLDAQPFELKAEGLLSVCIQHEVDHLDGRLFIEHLGFLKRLSVRKAFQQPEHE